MRNFKVYTISICSLILIAAFTNCQSSKKVANSLDLSQWPAQKNKARIIHYLNASSPKSQALIQALLRRPAQSTNYVKEYVMVFGANSNIKEILKHQGYVVINEQSPQYFNHLQKMPFYVVVNEKNQTSLIGKYNINPLTKSVNFF